MIRLNIGCGLDHKPQSSGWINIDCNPNAQPDLLLDVEKNGLPFSDSSVCEVFCSHMLEHCDRPEKTLREIQRVLLPEAIATIVLPHYLYLNHHRDLTHKVFSTSHTFDYDVQQTNYQTFFVIEKIGFTCPRPFKWLGLSFLEAIRFPLIFDLWFRLKKK